MLTTGDPFESNNSNTNASRYNDESPFDTDERIGCGMSNQSSFADDMDDFYDAAETEFINFDTFAADEPKISSRRGARCPIMGLGLHQSGEQLYAPYLQRALPLTDDVIAERRLMMYDKVTTGRTAGNDISSWQRLEVAHRLLKPKLLSDMQCFKAANPGASFHDFVSWYGNPTNPLLEDQEDLSLLGKNGPVTTDSAKTVLRVDCTRAMDLTRDFWFTTWEEANPIPAIEQGPLFDAESTVEMALDYLENIHPASLLCQIMAVNLCSAYFAIVASTGESLFIGIVSEALLQLRGKIEAALFLLSVDATRATGSISKSICGRNENRLRNQAAATDKSSLSDNMMVISVDALTASSVACEAIGQAEVLISRAASLLHKLDKQFDLVERILREREGTSIIVADHNAQQLLLSCMHRRQNEIPTMMSIGSTNKILPATREYMLQNMDSNNPCQLCVRYNDEGMKVMNDSADGQSDTRVSNGSMLLALAMTTNKIDQ
jgi:Rab3 GTPase-activating protein catalytic subunit